MTSNQPESNDPNDLKTAQLIERMSTQVSTLVRDELALATAELKQKGTRLGVGAGLSGVGGVLAFYGVGVLLAAAVLGLSTAIDDWISALIIGVVVLLLAGAAAKLGIGKVKEAVPPVPEQAVTSTQRDVAAVKENIQR